MQTGQKGAQTYRFTQLLQGLVRVILSKGNVLLPYELGEAL